MLRSFLTGVALLSLASAAQALTFTSAAGAPDPGFGPGETSLVDFDTPLAPGYTLSGSYALATGSVGSVYATPAQDTTRFFYVSSALGNGIATLTTPNLKSVSLYWGSIDNYNFLDVLGAGGATIGTVAGGALPPANGDQGLGLTNRRVFISADPGEVITGLRFRSTGIAFELDSIAGSAVPEPASWALLIAGFGLTGLAMRRRARAATVAA